MPYNTKNLLETHSKPVPQYFNDGTDQYEVVKGKNGASNVNLVGSLEDFKTAAITVGSTAIELTAGLAGRTQLIIYPPAVGTISWGKSDVTSANGAPLTAGDPPMEFLFSNTTLKVYAVSDGINREVRVVESK